MRLFFSFLCFSLSFFYFSSGSPPTCYSRVLVLSKEIMDILEKLYQSDRTKSCAEMMPKMFLDVHNSCMVSKLRDVMYVIENLPTEYCRDRPRIRVLRRKIQTLYSIITRVCYRDLVYHTDDCEALETGHSSPRFTEDRLQLLQDDN